MRRVDTLVEFRAFIELPPLQSCQTLELPLSPCAVNGRTRQKQREV